MFLVSFSCDLLTEFPLKEQQSIKGSEKAFVQLVLEHEINAPTRTAVFESNMMLFDEFPMMEIIFACKLMAPSFCWDEFESKCESLSMMTDLQLMMLSTSPLSVTVLPLKIVFNRWSFNEED